MRREKIGGYKVNQELGEGGMATVVRAREPRFTPYGRQSPAKLLSRLPVEFWGTRC